MTDDISFDDLSFESWDEITSVEAALIRESPNGEEITAEIPPMQLALLREMSRGRP